MKELMERVRLSENLASRVQVIYCRFEGVVIRRYRYVAFGDMYDVIRLAICPMVY